MKYDRNLQGDDKETVALVVWCAIGLSVVLTGIWGYYNFLHPYMHVWQESMVGQAELARAEYNRQIATLEAVAKKESAKALAEAEVIRAEGVARANRIIGDSLAGNEGYLRYLWIQGLQTNQMQVVYVPTEANLPIMESQRLKNNCEQVR